ncbi:MAG TPA: ABC transporter permease [Candidatus Eisenbacteria bacterium]|nr:ABC transporter permease [Candidatus Eisenbacteria bacterium]
MQTLILKHWPRLRPIFRRPLAIVVVLVALALGIAANTAVVNLALTPLVDSLLGPHLDRLLMLSERQPTGGNSPLIYSPADFDDLQKWNLSFAEVAAFAQKYTMLSEAGGSKFLATANVTAGFFNLLDAKPQVGRTFLRQEDQPGGEEVVVVSDRLWRQRFDSDPKIIEKSITLDRRSYQVVGVMPADFQFPDQTDLWIPLALGPREKADRTSFYLNVLARLKPGVSVRQAQVELRGYLPRITPQNALSLNGRNVLLDPVYDHLKSGLQAL